MTESAREHSQRTGHATNESIDTPWTCEDCPERAAAYGLKVVTYWSTLMALAQELGRARMSGDAERIAAAERKHDAYRDVCLASDQMVLGVRSDL